VKGDCTLRGFEHVGKAIFCGKVKRKKKEHEAPGAEDKTRQRTMLQTTKSMGVDALAGSKGGGSVGTWKQLNTVNMTAWVHKECDIIEEEALTKLQEAWDNSDQKDECTVCLDELEQAYWMGTEVGLLGGYGFQGDIGCGWVVQRWKDGVRVLQIQGGRCGKMCTSWQRGGRHELKQARVGRDCTSVAVSSS
jgi:hypothetical protein